MGTARNADMEVEPLWTGGIEGRKLGFVRQDADRDVPSPATQDASRAMSFAESACARAHRHQRLVLDCGTCH
jgi:hypothetical protein